MNIEQIREKLKDRRLYVISERTGISYSTLNRIMRGYGATSSVMNKIEEYLTHATTASPLQ